MNTHKLSRHRIVRIAVVATGTLALCSGGAYALASTSGGTPISSSPASPQTHNRLLTAACPMITANHRVRGRCVGIGRPITHCPRNAMCAPLCIIPVTTAAGAGRLVPPVAARRRCVLPPVIIPGGPMMPAPCPPNAMCVRPCVIPVETPAGTRRLVPPTTMRRRCVILRDVTPGGPMIPAGSGASSGSAAGSPPPIHP